MRELEKKLKAIQKQGYENVDIIQVLNWMSEIKRDRAGARIERLETKNTQYSKK